MLRLNLLGEFELLDATGGRIHLKSRKDLAVLVYLAIAEEPVDRSRILALLWSDRAEEQARKSLRQSLVVLRQALNRGADVIASARHQKLQIDRSQISIDIKEFDAAALSGDHVSAARLYGGPLLDGFRSPTAAFEDWLTVERRHYADLAGGIFADLAEAHLFAQDWSGAAEAARRAVEIDSLNENGHRLLMRALARAGRRNEALQQFHRLTGLLRNELDVRPDAETMALYGSIREGKARQEAALSAHARNQPSSSARPGVAVLPLRFIENSIGDEAIADGLTDELIASLAAYRWFFVTSALQAAAFRGRNVEPRDLHDQLGVRYVLTGTLRRSGNRLAVRLDLSDPLSGQHIWSERQYCYLDEVLEAQDELARLIATAIEPEILKAEEDIALRIPLEDFSRWEQLAKARRLSEQGGRSGLTQGVDLAAEVVRRHPDCAHAQATLGWNAWLKYVIAGRPADSYARDQAVVEQGITACETAIKLDPRLYLGHAAIGGWHTKFGRYERAAATLRQSIDLNPSFPTSYNQLISCLTRAGLPRDALEWIEPLDRISPSDVFRGYYCCVRSLTWFYLGDDERAVANAEESLRAHAGWLSSELLLIAASRRMGDRKTSDAAANRLLAARGPISREQLHDVFPMRREADFDTMANQLAGAGILTM